MIPNYLILKNAGEINKNDRPILLKFTGKIEKDEKYGDLAEYVKAIYDKTYSKFSIPLKVLSNPDPKYYIIL